GRGGDVTNASNSQVVSDAIGGGKGNPGAASRCLSINYGTARLVVNGFLARRVEMPGPGGRIAKPGLDPIPRSPPRRLCDGLAPVRVDTTWAPMPAISHDTRQACIRKARRTYLMRPPERCSWQRRRI